jgi:hypothetical protein
MHDTGSITPICPRCGYDQSGEVAAWTDQCPLRGLCPECGTGFAWADLFDPARQDIRWLVEHAPDLRGRAGRTVPTLWRMAWPWVFWRRVDIHARTAPRAAAGWLLLIWAMAHLATWLPFSLLFAMMGSGYWLSVDGARTYLRESSRTELIDAALTGFLWPVVSVFNLRPSWIDYYGGREFASVFRVPLGMGLTWFAVMAVLPVTRRLAKLRRAHLLRALLFQWAMIVPAYYAVRVLFPFGETYASIAVGLVGIGIYLLLCVWSLGWWVAALRVGWGVRSWPLTILATLAAILGGVVAATVEDSVIYLLWIL